MPPLIVYIADPFDRENALARTGLAGANALAEVRRVFPETAGLELVVTRKGKRLAGDESLYDGDVLEVMPRPMWAAIIASPFWTAVVTSLISAAISFLVAYLTKPKNRNKNASPSYNINFDQNVPRLGDTIPVCYGRVLSTPDVASQPYSEYVAHNERANMILCLGMGEFQINDIFFGESRVADYPPGNISTWIFPPSVHQNRFGVIEQQTGVCENMITLPESTGVDLAAPNDPPEVAVAASVSGGTLIPKDATSTQLWNGLVPGRQYTVSNSVGGSAIVRYVGQGPNNSAVFDGPLPAPGGWVGVDVISQLTAIDDAQEGRMMLLYTQQEVPQVAIGEIIYVQIPDAPRFGPFEVARSEVRWTRLYLRTSGPGFTSATGESGFYPQRWSSIIRNDFVLYYVSEYVGTDAAEPYRWRGWYATSRPGVNVDTVYVDLAAPSGIAWITDKGDYKNITVTMFVDIQRIDDNNNPIGGLRRETIRMSGATSTARRISFRYAMDGPGRFRVRVARASNRDQRASKEISSIVLSSIRTRVCDMPIGARCYENATLIVMQFNASAGLAAATSRRVKVDATRKVLGPDHASLIATTNPADHVLDAYTSTSYGGGRPISEVDTAKLLQLRTQWDQTPGFNAIFDSPTTLVEALQTILGPVRAMPLPVGRVMSFQQDCPRPKNFVFGPDVIVKGSLQVAYNFAGVDEPDCLEVTYTDPFSWADARVYYPSEGIKPERMELFGSTSRTHTLSWARLAWQERQLAKKTIRFDLEGEGYMLNPLTRFGVIVPAVDHSISGAIVQLDREAQVVTLDAPFPNVPHIYFRAPDGTIGGPYAAACPDPLNRYVVYVDSLPWWALGPDAQWEGGRWMAGTGQNFDFRVTDLQSSENMRISVDGTEYKDAIYAGTFVEHWSP